MKEVSSVSRYDIDKDLFENIEIPNYIKRELYKDCKRGKRAADLRFRYAGPLTALIVMAAVGLTGFGVKAGYDTWVNRMKSMPETEKTELFEEIKSDESVTMDGAWSRQLTNVETLKIADLERKYYDSALFPEGEVQRLEKLSDWDGKSLCFIEEDQLLHLPEAEMTEEQMLQFIDYNAKKEYLIENNADEIWTEEDDEWVDEDCEETPSPYVDVDSAIEEDIIKVATPHLTKFLGWEPGSEWVPHVEAFMPSNSDPEFKDHDMYSIIWEKDGVNTANGSDYIVCLGMHDLHFIASAIRGREHWATLKTYTDKEAMDKAEKDKAKIYKVLKDMYGLPAKPDSERMDLVDDYGSKDDIRQMRFVFDYGNLEVDVEWDLGGERLDSIEIFPEGY
jgi:hypothetical protein